jgi:hypothetical protein
MAVALVADTLGTFRHSFLRCFMDMERRNEEHRHVDCQQHTRGNLSLCHHVHWCKNTAFLSNKKALLTQKSKVMNDFT